MVFLVRAVGDMRLIGFTGRVRGTPADPMALTPDSSCDRVLPMMK
jgi:hypothetical protein